MATPVLPTPWAMRLVTDRLPVGPAAYATVEMNAATQTAVYTDTVGQIVEMAKHGTNKSSGTTTKSGGGGDGSGPQQPQTNDDNNVDYTSD